MSLVKSRTEIASECISRPRATDAGIAKVVFAHISQEELSELAMLHLTQMVWEHRRYGQLVVERSSSGYQVSRAMNALISDPALLYGTQNKRASEATHPGFDSIRLGQRKGRERFAEVAGEKFDTWLQKAEKIAKSSGMIDSFNFHWKTDFSSSGSLLTEAIDALISNLSSQIRLDITKELLNTEFALGDGVRVTWGVATIEQHQKRIVMLRNNINANVEAASRHEAAISLLKETKKPCLAKVRIRA